MPAYFLSRVLAFADGTFVVLGTTESQATELKAQLRERGLRLSGNKADLLARLEEALLQS